MKRLTIIVMLLGLTNSHALETDKAAHFGISYAFQTTTYGFSRKALRLDKTDAMVFSVFTSILLTTAAEYMGGSGSHFDGGDIKANVLGVGAASATILMFDF